jgi:DNA-binding CsgD family transcriptional regulator/DNA-binding transcriptional ArsR family regulator
VTVARLADAAVAEPRPFSLLERERELAILGRALADAAAGRGRLAVVEGPAGIGKTTLVRAAVQLARERGLTALSARASPLEQEFSFGVVRQLFEPLGLDPQDTAPGGVFTGAAALAARALADVSPGEAIPAEDVSFSVLHGLYWLTANVAGGRPLVLVVDDCHWADGPSLRFLAHLAARLDELPVLVIVALRAHEPKADAELLESILAFAQADAIRPAPLGPDATARLVRAAVGEAATARFSEACHEATGGNPLLLRALLTSFSTDGGAPDDHAAARVTVLGAEGVMPLLARRLASLPAGGQDVASALAVLGDGSPLKHVAALAGSDLDRAAALADDLRAATVLADADALAFAHPVLRVAAYETLGRDARSVAHGRAAELLAADGAPADRIALHLLRAHPRGDAAVVATLQAAARLALNRGAPETATAYLRRALEEPPAAGERGAVLLELGLALVASRRDPEAVEHLREAVGSIADPDARRAAALAAGRVLGIAGFFEDAAALLEPIADADLRVDAEVIAVCSLIASRVPVARARLARHATDLPDVPGSRLILVMLAQAGLFDGGHAAHAAELLERAFDGPELLGEGSMVAVGAAMSLIVVDRLDEAEALCSAVIAEGERLGAASLVATFGFPRAFGRLRRGLLREAEADARWSFEQKLSLGVDTGPPHPLAFLLDALTEQGNLEGANEALGRLDAELLERPPELLGWALVLEARGRLRLAEDRLRDGIDDLFEAGRRWERLQIHAPGAARWREDAALGLARLGDLADARGLADEHLARARRTGLPRLVGSATRVVGTVSPRGDGIPLLRHAIECLERAPAPLELARARVELGSALRREGHRVEAREHLRRGLEAAHRAGAAPLAARARAELVAAGSRPRRPVFTGVDALTATELRVAGLAAEGRTNREIAQRLFVTQRTVETHLRHVFQKLDIRGRDELPRELAPAAAQDSGA